MIRLSGKSRRVLRAIYRGLGATAAALTLNACNGTFVTESPVMYGPGPDRPYDREELLIHGSVKSKKTGEPITGIHIWFKGVTANYTYSASTYAGGIFSFYLPKKDDYTIIFTDVDGVENGGSYKQHTINLTWEQAEAQDELIIELEEVDVE